MEDFDRHCNIWQISS